MWDCVFMSNFSLGHCSDTISDEQKGCCFSEFQVKSPEGKLEKQLSPFLTDSARIPRGGATNKLLY